MKKVTLVVLAITLMLGVAAAQNVGNNSVYFTTYYSNNIAAAPDATVRFINDGVSGANLYASIYVFDDSEELTQCCSCAVTPDGLLSESVKNNLTNHSLRGVTPSRGVIKVISSSREADASTGFAANTPTPGLRGWATHIQSSANRFPTGPEPYSQTETQFADSNLTAGEQSMLQQLCLFDSMLSGEPCTCNPKDLDF
jgi:hypothetical protein